MHTKKKMRHWPESFEKPEIEFGRGKFSKYLGRLILTSVDIDSMISVSTMVLLYRGTPTSGLICEVNDRLLHIWQKYYD